MTTSAEEKRRRLMKLVQLRREEDCPVERKIGHHHKGIYECDFVSPCAKEAHNFDSPIMIVGQDWSSQEDCEKYELDPAIRNSGFSPCAKTTKVLRNLLHEHFKIALEDTYATNLYPFLKEGGVSASIDSDLLKDAAEKYTVEEIKIIKPKLIIVLGVTAYRALLHAVDPTITWQRSLDRAIKNSPTAALGGKIWCQAHAGNAAGRTSVQVKEDWKIMADTFLRECPDGHPASKNGM